MSERDAPPDELAGDGMAPMLLWIFQGHIAEQCRLVELGAEIVEEALSDRSTRPRLWSGVQMVLTGAANISKALWGVWGNNAAQRSMREAKRAPVRTSLQVTDESPLRDLRVRDHFEHLDQRLFEWWDKSERHMFLDDHIGPLSTVAGLSENEMFRFLDDQTMTVIFWGQTFDLRAVTDEARRLLAAAETATARPWWG